MAENEPGTPPPTPPPPTPPPAPVEYHSPPTATDPESRQWGMFAHLSAIVASLVGLPFLGPLVVYLMKKDQNPFVADQAKEALNFNITVMIAIIVLVPTVCIGIGAILLPAVGVAALVLTIIAAVKANEGVAYRYPATLRLIK